MSDLSARKEVPLAAVKKKANLRTYREEAVKKETPCRDLYDSELYQLK